MSIFRVFRRPKAEMQQQASLQQQPSRKKVQTVATAIQTFRVDQLPTTVLGEIIDEYKIGEEARVTIADEGGHARYIISEPQLTEGSGAKFDDFSTLVVPLVSLVNVTVMLPTGVLPVFFRVTANTTAPEEVSTRLSEEISI